MLFLFHWRQVWMLFFSFQVLFMVSTTIHPLCYEILYLVLLQFLFKVPLFQVITCSSLVILPVSFLVLIQVTYVVLLQLFTPLNSLGAKPVCTRAQRWSHFKNIISHSIFNPSRLPFWQNFEANKNLTGSRFVPYVFLEYWNFWNAQCSLMWHLTSQTIRNVSNYTKNGHKS